MNLNSQDHHNAGCQDLTLQYTSFFKRLQQFRISGEYCDAAVEVSGVLRKCHLLVLASSSELLHASIQSATFDPGNERNLTVLTLPSCFEIIGLDAVLDFLYNGTLTLREDTVCYVFYLARYLQLPVLVAACLSVMKGDCDGVPLSVAPPVVRSISQTISCISSPFKQAPLDEDKVVSDFNNLTKVASHVYENLGAKSTLKASLCIEEDRDLPPISSPCMEMDGVVPSVSSPHTTDDVDPRSSARNNQHRCPSCSLLCVDKMDLKRHINRQHGAKKYKCSQCPKSFKRKADAEIHKRRKHVEVKPFACDHCSKTFSISSELVTHLRSHRDGFAFKCGQCGKTFISELGYKRHCDRAHKARRCATETKGTSSTAVPPRQFQCGECGRTFGWPHLLRRHVEAVHLKLRPHKCPQCNLSFHREEQLRQHSASHTGKQEYRCQECGKAFRQKSGLCVHKKKHSDANKVVCDVCGYHCYSVTVLRIHQQSHSTERPFACDKCSKKFKSKKQLQSHLKSHDRVPKKKSGSRLTTPSCSSNQSSASLNAPPPHMQAPHPTSASLLDESVNNCVPDVITDDDPKYVVLSSANLNNGGDDGDCDLAMYLNHDSPAFGGYRDHSIEFGPSVEQTSDDFLSSVFQHPDQPPGQDP